MSEFREIFENNYTDSDTILEHLIKPVFGDKIKSANMSIDIDNQDKGTVNNIVIFATLGGSIPVNFVDVTLNDKIKLHHNKVSIQRCVRKIMDTLTSSLIFFHYENPENRSWRITFVNKGENNKEFTDSKRYTYLCGMNYSCRTADERFTKLQKEIAAGNKILDELMIDCFDVEPLSNEFFEKYREHYADLVEYISGKRFVKKGGKFIEEKTKNANGAFKDAFSGDDKAVRDYVKKMMGRLVFLQFLQKKGWLGVEEGKPWGTGDRNFIFNLFKNAPENIKKDFLESALEPLFFNSLNNDRGKEAIAPESICNIYGKKVRIPYLNGGLFEEDELDKKKVKFKKEHFEALLEFFNQYNFTIDETDPDDTEIGVDPEMLGKIFENLLEDNKDKGAFYTPKEIVQYMCRESLIAYLLTDSKISDDKIRNFVINHNCSLNESEKADILKALRNVKVCDPAVGSGAFPMGMLNELLNCTQTLTGESKTRAELKKHIVKNNIYGVDIEKGAVDIARLRFWLAIIVDEENPLPLPNLDYKIMQGNSLLESFEGIDLSNLCKVEKGALFSAEKEVNTLVTTLSHYFDTQNHEERDAHRTAIREAVYDLLKARNCGNDNDVITKLKKIDLHENNQFFLWHTWFSDVFNRRSDCNGFDIVIGNPPYVESRSSNFPDSLKNALQNSIAKRYDSETSKSFPRGADLLIFFYELSFRLINSKGINTFITENAWLSTDYGKVFQDYLLKNIGVQGIIDSDYKYFETADINTVITFFRKEKRDDVVFFHCHDNFSDHHCNTLDSNANKGKIDILRFETSSSMLHSYKWGFLSSTKPELISLLNKMCKINDIEFQGKIEIGQGLNLTKDKVLTVQTKNTVPFYISDNGPKYNWESSLFYVDKENISETRRIPLMFLPRGLGTHFCCMNEIAGFTSSYVEIYEKENLTDIEKLCIWIFCNSSLLWLLREYTGRFNLGGGMLKAEATDLKSLPLCFRFGNIQEMQDIYNLSKGKSNPTDINDSLNTEIHKRIDKLVYDFFQLKDSDFFTQMLADRVKWRNKKSKSK